MKQYQVVLKNGKVFNFKGNIVLFNDQETIKLTSDDTILINANEVSYIKPL